MELISVIVPIYNCEKYLRECIDSILSNSYQTLEVILVNDGSTDSSPAVCDEYSLRDSRIKVIHQKNTGPVGARNTGLAHAHGRYVAFADADDVVSSTFYEIMVNAMESTGADIAACEFCTKIEDLSAAGGG